MLSKSLRRIATGIPRTTSVSSHRCFADESKSQPGQQQQGQQQQDITVQGGNGGGRRVARGRSRSDIGDVGDWGFFGRRGLPMALAPFSVFDRDFFEPTWSLFDRDFADLTRSVGDFQPRVDISEDEKAIYVHAELPGLNKSDVTLKIQDGILELKGTKNVENKQEDRRFRRTERVYGSFVRRVPIDRSVKPEEVKAKYENGVLEVTVPKKSETEAEGMVRIE